MKKILFCVCILSALITMSMRAQEAGPDTDAGKRISAIVLKSDYALIKTDEGGEGAIKVTDKKWIEAVAGAFKEAVYYPQLHSLSVSPAQFTFYKKDKIILAVSFQPGEVVRFSNQDAEENFQVSTKTRETLINLAKDKSK